MKKISIHMFVATVLVILLALTAITTVTANGSDTIVIPATELAQNTLLDPKLLGAISLVKNDTLKRNFIRVSATANGVVGDNAAFDFDLSSYGISAKSYPYIQIGYIAKTANAKKIDFNAAITNYHKAGTDTLRTTRLWGPKPIMPQNTHTKFNVNNTDFTGCDAGTYSLDYFDDTSTYEYLRFKPWYFDETVIGDYFEVDYVAFFKTTAARSGFVLDTSLKSFSVDEAMTLTKGETKSLSVKFEPVSAYAKFYYESDNENVVKVTSDGLAIALREGVANITVKANGIEGTKSCKITVTGDGHDYSKYIYDRDDLENLVYKLNNEKKLTVVYIGGSITVGQGSSNSELYSWRALTGNWLKSTFPDATFSLINVAQGGSGSMLAAFRTDVDVLAHKPDLVFIEFAANDYMSGHYADGTVQLYYESIIRQIREKSPDTEIISVFTTVQSRSDATEIHPTASLQNEVAKHYGVTGIDVGLALLDRIREENSAWSDYIADTVHPADTGHALYADAIKQYLFEKLFGRESAPDEITKHTLPKTYVDERNKTFVPEYVVVKEDIFEDLTNWSYNSSRAFGLLDTAGYIYPSGNNNSFSYTFTGTGIAFFMEFNINVNNGLYNYLIDFSIDGGVPTKIRITDTNHAFNKMYKTGELKNGKHTITFRYLGIDKNADMIVDEGETGVRPGLKITRFLVSKLANEVPEILYGDVNSDKIVDSTDSVTLSRHLAGWTGYESISLENSDVDGIVGVESGDAVVLSRHLASWTGYETLPLSNNK